MVSQSSRSGQEPSLSENQSATTEDSPTLGGVHALNHILDELSAIEDHDQLLNAIQQLTHIRDSSQESLLDSLQSDDPDIRRVAAGLLGVVGDPAVIPALIPPFNSDNQTIRILAIRSLGSIASRHPQASEQVLDLLTYGEDSADVQFSIFNALCDIPNPRKAEGLLRMMDVQDIRIRRGLVDAIANLEDPACAPHLINGFDVSDRNRNHRYVQAIKTRLIAYGREITPHLLEGLAHDSAQVRWNVIDILSSLEIEEALPAIIECLPDEGDFGVRRSVLTALQVFQENPLAQKTAVGLLEHPDVAMRTLVVSTLGKMGKVVEPALIEALSDENPMVRRRIVEIIGSQKLKGATSEVVSLLETEAEENLVAVIRCVGDLQAQSAIPILIDLYPQLANDHLKATAIISLGKIKDPSALPFLHQTLSKADNRTIRTAGVEALGFIKQAESFPLVMEIFDSLSLRDQKKGVKHVIKFKHVEGFREALIPYLEKEWTTAQVIVELIGKTRDSSYISDLLPLLEHDRARLVKSAIKAIHKLGGDDLEPLLIDLLDDERMSIRHIALKTLASLGSDSIYPHLLAGLRDEHHYVRVVAIQNLVNFPGPETTTALINALDDPRIDVTFYVISTLRSLGDPLALPHLYRLLENPAEIPQGEYNWIVSALEYAIREIEGAQR